jgi:hypothetical protein
MSIIALNQSLNEPLTHCTRSLVSESLLLKTQPRERREVSKKASSFDSAYFAAFRVLASHAYCWRKSFPFYLLLAIGPFIL